jgi:hypothetical protein
MVIEHVMLSGDEALKVNMPASGFDPSGKDNAIYSALTKGVRYFYLKTFKIISGEDKIESVRDIPDTANKTKLPF